MQEIRPATCPSHGQVPPPFWDEASFDRWEIPDIKDGQLVDITKRYVKVFTYAVTLGRTETRIDTPTHAQAKQGHIRHA